MYFLWAKFGGRLDLTLESKLSLTLHPSLSCIWSGLYQLWNTARIKHLLTQAGALTHASWGGQCLPCTLAWKPAEPSALLKTHSADPGQMLGQGLSKICQVQIEWLQLLWDYTSHARSHLRTGWSHSKPTKSHQKAPLFFSAAPQNLQVCRNPKLSARNTSSVPATEETHWQQRN